MKVIRKFQFFPFLHELNCYFYSTYTISIELKIMFLKYFLLSMVVQPETAVAVSCLLTAGEKKAAGTHNWSSWAVPGKVCTVCSTLTLSVTILNCTVTICTEPKT